MFNLDRSPYSLSTESSDDVGKRIQAIEERVSLLRHQGKLTQETVVAYYGQKRFEQVAESNALEGSTLDVGETQVAIMKGLTITGHDPAYVRDAIALDRALTRALEISRESTPTDIPQLQEIHALLLGGRPGAGVFRNEKVRIGGSDHRPPSTIREILDQVEHWERWSDENKEAPAPFKAAVLHAWLTHIHPFLDGNGRSARAIGNLELIRAGYPPIIIKKKDRERYLEALSESDRGGDIRSFLDLILDHAENALVGLELAAGKVEGFSLAGAKLRKRQEQQLTIWATGVKLLGNVIEHHLTTELEGVGGKCSAKIFDSYLDLDDYLNLCGGRTISGGWAFIFNVEVPALEGLSQLAYVGHRGKILTSRLGEMGPSMFWSRVNPDGYPKWIRDEERSPYAIEITTRNGNGDEWLALCANGTIVEHSTTDLARKIADAMIEKIGSRDRRLSR